MPKLPSVSTDQVAAFVEVANQGSLRGAAAVLHVTEQGLRSRLLALERSVGMELYRKARGIRKLTPLTPQGQQFLPHAIAFLEQARGLVEHVSDQPGRQRITIVASQYLASYVLIRVIEKFHRVQPHLRVQLRVRTESAIASILQERPDVHLGFAAPYESSPDLHYAHLFSMEWNLVTAQRHPLACRSRVRLADIAAYPLIVYEQGSTGRQHVMEAFAKHDLSPQIEMETTTTDLILRMVEANLAVSIVPLLGKEVTRGRRVAAVPLHRQIRAIDSGILTRRNETLSPTATAFVCFVREVVGADQ